MQEKKDQMQRFPPSTLHALLFASIFGACSLLEPTSPGTTDPDSFPVEAAWLQVAPRADTLNAIGDTLRLYATVVVGDEIRTPQSGVLWQSLDPGVATVNVLGEVVARAVGVVLITASCDCAVAKDTATVHVTQVLASVSVRPEGATLPPLGSEQLTATPADSNGVPIGGLTLTWQSSNPAVATVTNGQVKAEAAGASLITAVIGDRVGWSAVTVSTRSVASISVEPVEATIAFGDTLRFRATAYDSTGAVMEGASFGWASSDTAIATVMAGLAKGRAAGTTVITASAGGKTGSSAVTVLPPPVHTISVSPAQSTLDVGGAVRLTAEAYDVNGDVIEGTSFTWSSSAPDVARVTDGLVEALSAGSAVITASTAGVSGTASVTVQSPPPPPPSGVIAAFPGAEGHGALALSTCDRSRLQVLKVTNLRDDGSPGSLGYVLGQVRDDVLSVIVFQVAGYITLSQQLRTPRSCLYVAGQTAPGGGITIRRAANAGFSGVQFSGHDVVVRYLRVRLGRGDTAGTGGVALDIRNAHNVVLDHLSLSWATDKNLVVTHVVGGNDLYNVSVQRTILSEVLAAHPTASQISSNDRENAPISRIDVHHNLFASNSHRNPNGITSGLRVVNNVVYNWSQGSGQGENKAVTDWIKNYYKPGPMTLAGGQGDGKYLYEVTHFITSAYANPSYYVVGNVGPHNLDPHAGSDEQWEGPNRVVACYYTCSDYADGTPGQPLPAWARRDTPLPEATVPMRIELATAAYESVLNDVGANARLACDGDWIGRMDSVDGRVISDARNGTGPARSPQSETEVGGYPTLDPGTPCADSDGDGMPDAFESLHGFDRANPADAAQDANGDGYTNLEAYLNGTSPR